VSGFVSHSTRTKLNVAYIRTVKAPYYPFQRRLRRLNIKFVTFLLQFVESGLLQELMETAFHLCASPHYSLDYISGKPLEKGLLRLRDISGC